MVEANENTTTLPTEVELLFVGREKELAKFQQILKDRQTVLVVITGMAGVGKSSLLQRFRELAEDAGWNTAPVAASESLQIDQETTPENFSTQLQARLSVPSSKSYIEKPSRSLVDSATSQPLLPIVEQLRALAPLLLLIDGYQPELEFSDWFQNSFIKDVKRAGATIVTIVTERPDGATKISPIAEETIQLGALDEHSIRQHFTELGRQISPSMSGDEINEYVKAAQTDSELLGSLTRVLRLALPSET